MAQFLTPVCTDPFKLQNPVHNYNAFPINNKWRVQATRHHKWRVMGQSKRRGSTRLKAVADDDLASMADDLPDDYYAVLGLTPDATPQQIKKAYYNCMKSCHPDLSGDDPETNDFCKFINEVYGVLSDPVQRMVYDEIQGYSLTAINPFIDESSPRDHVFVDEFSCIGCKNCANVAPDVFQIEEDYGRARAYKQCGVSDLVEQAIESCPVDCIHWTSAAQLTLLEDEMRRVERVNIGFDNVVYLQDNELQIEGICSYLLLVTEKASIVSLKVAFMLAGMGASSDVFRMANSRWEKRQSNLLEKARLRMMKQNGAAAADSYWDNLWGKQKDYQSTEEEVKERAGRAAAAARRWREYSRKGADKRPTYKLPEAVEVSKE